MNTMKQSAKKRIIIWAIVSGILLSVLISSFSSASRIGLGLGNLKFFGTDLNQAFSNKDNYTEGGAEFAADKIKSIDVDWGSGKIALVKSTDNKISISESGASDNNKMCWLLSDNGKLSIHSTKKVFGFFVFGNFNDKKELTISVPEGVTLNSLEIDAASADIDAELVNAKDFDVDTASGSINIQSLTADSASIDTVSGSITADCHVSGKLNADCVSGTCKITGDYLEADFDNVSGNTEIDLSPKASSIKIDDVSGSVKVNVPADCKGFSVTHESVSGSFNCAFTGTAAGDTFTYGSGGAKISVETVSGSVDIISKDN